MTGRLGVFFLALTGIQSVISCASAAPVRGDSLPAEIPPLGAEQAENGSPLSTAPADAADAGSIAEIYRLTESGSLASMLRALRLISERNLGASEFGRLMSGVNAALIRRIYPDAAVRFSIPDLPRSHVYARIVRDADRGVYTPPAAGSADYLEHVLPFLALLGETREERLRAALPDLEQARELRPDSALAPYFSGIVFERAGRFADAESAYTAAWRIAPDCYPAALGLVRILNRSDRKKEALRLLAALAERHPDNTDIRRQLARGYYEDEDWPRAEAEVAEVLRGDGRDGEFILMRARILMEQGRFAQAQAPLDLYAPINPNNRLYLLLRARLQAEGYRNREAALGHLRAILRVSPGDEEALAYAARLLMESPAGADQSEGRELLGRLLGAPRPSLAALSLGLRDAVSREDWREAEGFVQRLLDERRSRQDLLDACAVENGLGNKSRAFAYAKELYERDPGSDEGAAVYASALIDAGRREEAGGIIASRLAAPGGGPLKGRFYYLRSRLRTGEEAVLADLRSCLFEDPRNLDALIAMFEIYRRRKDEPRALYYLKQALAVAPGSARLKRYEREYSAPAN